MSQILVWITSKLMDAKLIEAPLIKKKKKNHLLLHNPVNKYINVSISIKDLAEVIFTIRCMHSVL